MFLGWCFCDNDEENASLNVWSLNACCGNRRLCNPLLRAPPQATLNIIISSSPLNPYWIVCSLICLLSNNSATCWVAVGLILRLSTGISMRGTYSDLCSHKHQTVKKQLRITELFSYAITWRVIQQDCKCLCGREKHLKHQDNNKKCFFPNIKFWTVVKKKMKYLL